MRQTSVYFRTEAIIPSLKVQRAFYVVITSRYEQMREMWP